MFALKNVIRAGALMFTVVFSFALGSVLKSLYVSDSRLSLQQIELASQTEQNVEELKELKPQSNEGKKGCDSQRNLCHPELQLFQLQPRSPIMPAVYLVPDAAEQAEEKLLLRI